MSKNEQVKTKPVKLEQMELPNYAAEARGGFDGVTAADLKIPFLTVLQSMSPQVKKKTDAYVEGAEPGFILETVSKRVYDTDKSPILIIPCGFKKAFVEWVPRELGGGFVKAHTDASILDTCHRENGSFIDVLPNGNHLNTTAYHTVLLVEDGSLKPCVISMTATQLKHSKGWLSQMQSLKMTGADGKKFTPPMYAHYWKVDTITEENNKGSFYSWRFTLGELVKSIDTFGEAKELNQSVTRGQLALANTPQETTVEVM